MGESEERDESLEEQVEEAFDALDDEEPWTISGVDPTTGEVLSERVSRSSVATLLEYGHYPG
jgi:hypothetical protein